MSVSNLENSSYLKVNFIIGGFPRSLPCCEKFAKMIVDSKRGFHDCCHSDKNHKEPGDKWEDSCDPAYSVALHALLTFSS